MKPLLLVDGHNLLWKAHYGFPTRIIGLAGEDVTTLFGFFAILRSSIRACGQDIECVICFDGQNGSANRRSIFPSYKLNRDILDNAPINALAEVKQGLDRAAISWIEIDNAEADDVIATVCTTATSREITIMSSDKDYYQLICDRVTVYSPSKKAKIGAAEVYSKFSISPAQWCDFIALCGDVADNIPGIPGIGQKTAARLLMDDKVLEDVFSNVGPGGNISPKFLRYKELAFMFRSIVQLSRTVVTPNIVAGNISPPLPLAREILKELGHW
jgi:DNA polymerase-1